jgi:hypothetical protein
VAFARDGSVLTIAQRGRWACLTITRDDGGPRVLDILLDADDSGQLVRWLTQHREAQSTRNVG